MTTRVTEIVRKLDVLSFARSLRRVRCEYRKESEKTTDRKTLVSAHLSPLFCHLSIS